MARQTSRTDTDQVPADETLGDLNARIAAAGAAATTAEARGGAASTGGLVGVTADDTAS